MNMRVLICITLPSFCWSFLDQKPEQNGITQANERGFTRKANHTVCGDCYCSYSPDQDVKQLIIESEHRLLGIITQMSTRINMVEARQMETKEDECLPDVQLLENLRKSMKTLVERLSGYSCIATENTNKTEVGFVCFKFYAQLKNWNQAKEECERNFARLATIRSKEEDDFITTLITGSDDIVWFGLVQASRFTYEWSSGETLQLNQHDGTSLDGTYTDWQRPDQWDVGISDPLEEACIGKWHAQSYRWADYYCHRAFPYVCEFRTDMF